jgi:hypothetical protein
MTCHLKNFTAGGKIVYVPYYALPCLRWGSERILTLQFFEAAGVTWDSIDNLIFKPTAFRWRLPGDEAFCCVPESMKLNLKLEVFLNAPGTVDPGEVLSCISAPESSKWAIDRWALFFTLLLHNF